MRTTARPSSRAGLAALAFVALTGCTSVHLDQLPVTGLSASLPDGPALAPGASEPLVVVASTQDGQRLASKGRGGGKVGWDNYEIQASTASVDRKGIVSLPADPRLVEGRVPHLRVAAKGHPEAVAELDVPPRYDAAFLADFSGAGGRGGFDGLAGQDGISGSMGSMDPEHPSAGGDGSDGGPGGNGDDGGPGGPGPALQVQVALDPGPRPLLQVRVRSKDREQFFLVDPQGGSLLVKADGGPGGRGGSGGRGGRGGFGGLGSPSGRNGLDGLKGMDGYSGSSGAGGSILVQADPATQPYLAALRFSNAGQPSGPAPDIEMLNVAPLW